MRYALMHRDARIALPDAGVVLGRAPSCDIVLEGEDVSRRHAKAVPAPDGVWIEDLESDNGTFVNGERIEEPRQLVQGDVITVGSHELRVVVDRSDSDTPQSLPVLWDPDEVEQEHTHAAGAVGMRFQAGVGLLAAGMVHRAERELGGKLRRLAEQVRLGRALPAGDAQMAVRFALRLARETRRASWLEDALELLRGAKPPLTADLVADAEQAVGAIGDPVLAARATDVLRTAGVTDPDVLERLSR